REIERNDRNSLAARVTPDVGFGPMQDRMHAKMRPLRRRCVEVVPEFSGLVADVPAAVGAAWRKHPLLGARGFFVAANAGEQPVKAVLGERKLQPFGLPRGGACRGWQGRIYGLERGARLDNQVEAPFLRI